MADQTPILLPMCPMAEACKGMMEKPFSGIALMVPGLIFITLGILVIIEPRILVWVMAAAFILIGVMMLMMASFVRNVGVRFQAMHRRGSTDQPTR